MTLTYSLTPAHVGQEALFVQIEQGLLVLTMQGLIPMSWGELLASCYLEQPLLPLYALNSRPGEPSGEAVRTRRSMSCQAHLKQLYLLLAGGARPDSPLAVQ